MLLFSSGTEIRRYIHKAKSFQYNDILLNERRVQDIDVDPERKILYWTDSSLQTIKRALIPEDPNQLTQSQDLNIQANSPHGIAVDWITK